jgi:hypothetical protein
MDVTISIAGVPIRLTHERWFHIVENHDDVAGYYEDVLDTVENPDLVLRGYRDSVENPDLVLRGYRDSLVAVRSYGRQRYLMVIYRQVLGDDGFIITAYFTRKIDRRKAVWRKP